MRLDARRAGIAPQAACAAVTDPVLAGRSWRRFGCLAVLRATYQDSTGAFAVTVGVAVLPGTSQVSSAVRVLPRTAPEPGLRAVPVQQHPAVRLHPCGPLAVHRPAAGSYMVMSTVGYADGRHDDVRESADPYDKDEMLSVADGITNWSPGRSARPRRRRSCPGGPAC